jgi:hypothetical protein
MIYGTYAAIAGSYRDQLSLVLNVLYTHAFVDSVYYNNSEARDSTTQTFIRVKRFRQKYI